MKIIEIIPQLSSGGAERFTVDLCNELSKQHKVILIVLHKLNKNGLFLKDLKTSVELICMNKRKGLDFTLFFKLKRLIISKHPDIVHTHLSGILYTAFAYLIKSTKIVFIHTIHNDAKAEAGNNIKKWIRLYAFKSQKVHPVTISEESQQSFYRFYQRPSALIYNGTTPFLGENNERQKEIQAELNNLKANRSSVNLLNVARIAPEKNLIMLSQAIIHLNKIGYSIDLFFIGRKDSEITSTIESFNSPYLHLLGERINPRNYMKEVDAFCLSSIYEGMPITLIECFSVGTIPICTPVGGIVNMIEDKKNGFLSQGTNQIDIEQAIKLFIETSTENKIQISKNSYKTFQKYHIKTCAEKYIQLINSLSQNNI